MYLTSTDGFCSAGHRPERSLAAYGAYLRAMPWSNEQGLRMLIGAAVQASTVFSGDIIASAFIASALISCNGASSSGSQVPSEP